MRNKFPESPISILQCDHTKEYKFRAKETNGR